MALQITVTVDESLWAVRLQATGQTGTVTWHRRYAGADTLVGTGTDLWDTGAELNVDYEWIATDDLETAVSAATEIASALPVLAPLGSLAAAQVTVVSVRPTEYLANSVWHPVLNRSDPFVTVHPMQYPRGTMRLHAATHGDMSNILELLPSGMPLLLRTTCEEKVPSMTFVVERATLGYWGGDRRDVPAWVDLDYQQVTESPDLPPAPARTYNDVLTGHATYQAVLDAYTDYDHVLAGL